MRCLENYLILLLWLCFFYPVSSQTFRTYGVVDGLPVSEINCISQDQKGFIWIGTHAGLSRFDGFNFINYHEWDGKKLGDIYVIQKGGGQDLFIGSAEGLFLYEESGYHYIDDPTFRTQRIYDIHIQDKQIYLCCTYGIYQSVYQSEDPSFNFQKIIGIDELPNVRAGDKFRKFAFTPDQHLYAGTLYGVYEIIDGKPHEIWNAPFIAEVTAMDHFGNDLYFATKKSVSFRYSKGKISKILPHNNTARDVSVVDSTLYLISDDHLYSIDISDNKADSIRLDGKGQKFFISQFQDKERNHWLATWEGILKISPTAFHEFHDLVVPEYYNAMITEEGLMFGGNKGRISQLIRTDTGYTMLPFAKINTIAEVFDMVELNDLYWIATGYDGIYVLDEFYEVVSHISDQLLSQAIYKLKVIGQELMAIGDNGISWISDPNTVSHKIGVQHQNAIVRFNDAIITEEDIWLTSKEGLYRVQDGQIIEDSITGHNANLEITSIVTLNDTSFVLGTIREGMLICSLTDGKLMLQNTIDKQTGLTSAYVLNMLFDGENLYTCMHDGINIFKQHESQFVLIDKCLVKDGFLSQTFQSGGLIKKENEIFFYSSNGGGAYQFAEPEMQVVDTMLLTSLAYEIEDRIYNIDISNHDRIQIPYNARNINIGYSNMSYQNPDDQLYVSQLEPYDFTSTSPLKGGQREFGKLKPGHYQFEVFDYPGKSHPAKISIDITFPFYQKWPFIISTSLLVGLGLYFLYQKRMQDVNRKLNMEHRIIRAELKALRSQMNPHFIFNSLNTIDSYIAKNDQINASKYLNSFAKLIRAALNNSRMGIIPLEQEIAFIKDYVKLEQKRLDPTFSFDIQIDHPERFKSTVIPPLLIQPVVENAIWHGISKIDDHREIFIHDFLQGDEYQICVTDNGPGFNSVKAKDNYSLGMHILKERIDLYNKTAKKNHIAISVQSQVGELTKVYFTFLPQSKPN